MEAGRIEVARLQLQASLGPALAQGEHCLQLRQSTPRHRQGWCRIIEIASCTALSILAFQRGQGLLQGLERHGVDRQAVFQRRGEAVEVAAEAPVGEVGAALQPQLLIVGIDPGDLRLHEGDAGAIGQGGEIEAHVAWLVVAGDEARDHAGIEAGAALAHEGDQPRRQALRLRSPAAQQQGVAVATAGEQ